MVEAKTLPSDYSAQNTKLIALIRAVELGKGKVVNIYTDYKCAYSILQALGSNRKGRGLLTSGNKKIKNGEEIMQLSEAILLPKEVEVIH